MNDKTKISDLTVAEFKQLMQQCLDRDRALEPQREMARRQANPLHGQWAAHDPARCGGSGYTNGGHFVNFWG